MAVIQEYMNGACHITVYDDKIQPPEEVQKIILWEVYKKTDC